MPLPVGVTLARGRSEVLMPQTLTPPKVTPLSKAPASRRGIGSPPVIAALIFLLINILIFFNLPVQKKELTKEGVLNTTNESLQKGPWSWWIARAFFENQPDDIVLMGDSQMNAAIFQADALARARAVDTVIDHEAVSVENRLQAKGVKGLHVINISTPGSFASDQFLVGEALFPAHPPKVVILGVSPRILIDCTLPSASSTETFKFFAPYVDLTSVADITFDGFFDRLNWLIEKHLPLSGMRDKAYASLSRLSAACLGKSAPKSPSDQIQRPQVTALQAITSGGDLGRGEAIIPNFRNYSYQDNTKEYLHRYRTLSAEQYIAQLTFLNKFLCHLHQMGARVIVVGMPSLPAHRKLLNPLFWGQYKQLLAQTSAKAGAEWHDLTDDTRFPQRFYLDNVHLNQDGGTFLVDILTEWLVKLPGTNRPNKPSP
jgi:hypothetical protein